MVERPIKKSERQALGNSQNSTEASETSANLEGGAERTTSRSEDRGANRSPKGKGDKKRRGKRDQDQEERAQPINPALMRGPKPVRPKPAPQVEEEATLEGDAEATVEADTATES